MAWSVLLALFSLPFVFISLFVLVVLAKNGTHVDTQLNSDSK
ncbi:MAG: hypothetical protein V3V20_11460 [Algisphaera sp.]